MTMTCVPFGPTRPVPAGHRWCMSCDGSGVDSLDATRPCRICRGKGHWNAADLDAYHAACPAACAASCGAAHRPLGPGYFAAPAPRPAVDFDAIDALVRAALADDEDVMSGDGRV